jgi:hypothetical protein
MPNCIVFPSTSAVAIAGMMTKKESVNKVTPSDLLFHEQALA